MKCSQSSCVFARNASDLDLVEFEIDVTGAGLSLKINHPKKFWMYKGFNLDSLEMNQDYIVASGCQMYNTINFSVEDVRKIDYNDECGVLIYDSKSPEDSAGKSGIIGAISDQRMEGLLYKAQGEIAIGQTADKKDGLMLATKRGKIKFYSIEEPGISAKDLNYKLEQIHLVIGDGQKLRLDTLFRKGTSNFFWKILTVLLLAVVVPGILIILLLRRNKRKQRELPSNEYLRESKEIQSLGDASSIFDDEESETISNRKSHHS